MTSQTDLDQGGTFRQFVRRWLGPSVGWVDSPDVNVLAVTAAGSYTLVEGATLVMVNIAGSVTIDLFNPLVSLPATTQPGRSLARPVTVVDIGGNATANPITINAPAGKTIMGLSSITISNDYGAFTVIPDLATGNWKQG